MLQSVIFCSTQELASHRLGAKDRARETSTLWKKKKKPGNKSNNRPGLVKQLGCQSLVNWTVSSIIRYSIPFYIIN